VLVATAATALYGGLVGWEHLPARLADDMRRFQWDYATFKVDWALSAPVPWAAPGVAEAGTVHLAASMDELSEFTHQLARGLIPGSPFLIVGQMTTADPDRSPPGTESLWAYTHVPRQARGDAGGVLTGSWEAAEADRFADRIEAQIERYAPGWRERILGRRLTTPAALQADNANLVGGAINGGTFALHQQMVFRPVPGLGRPETPIAGLYLASSSAHPGGAVHGACGANAARAALRADHLGIRRPAAALTRRMIG
jgi:phytoene dehydrogenase-like protein